MAEDKNRKIARRPHISEKKYIRYEKIKCTWKMKNEISVNAQYNPEKMKTYNNRNIIKLELPCRLE